MQQNMRWSQKNAMRTYAFRPRRLIAPLGALNDTLWVNCSTNLQVWLATPDAGENLDETKLGPVDACQWRKMASARRRRDWATSRALMMAHPATLPNTSSLSHSRGYAALARVIPGMLVGVDVEFIRFRNFLDLAELAFDVDELGYLKESPSHLLACRFYQFWTIKEAFAKALAIPLAVALRRCRCVNEYGKIILQPPTDDPWRVMVFAPRRRLRLAVVCVSRTTADLHYQTSTAEWPAPRRVPWPIVFESTHADYPQGATD